MVVALVLLLACLASAQTTDDARALLQEIASSSRDAKSWVAEGIRINELTGLGAPMRNEQHFKVAYQSPSRMLSDTKTTKETIGGIDSGTLDGTLTVRDGTDQWTLYSPNVSFYHSSQGRGPSRPELGDFSTIADNLVSATLTGRDHVQFAGASTECELVRAEYAVPVSRGDGLDTDRFTRTLCIDPVQTLILRDRTERSKASNLVSIETTTYTSYERDVDLPADLFQFQVPTGYFEDDGPQLPGDPVVENGVYRLGPQISRPTLISKVEPSSTAEAILAGVSGIVLVSFQVSSDGNLEKIKVIRRLGHGLDEKAVEAVRQWLFHPGTKDGVPVPVGPLKVAVSFPRP